MRIKGGPTTRRRHNKIRTANKGYRMTKHRLYKVAKEAYLHAGQYSYDHRKKRGSEFRKIWVARINAAAHLAGTSYSRFIHNLRQKNVQLNSHVLAELAVNSPEVFSKLLDISKS